MCYSNCIFAFQNVEIVLIRSLSEPKLIFLFDYILNKSKNATPELFATHIQNDANQECN